MNSTKRRPISLFSFLKVFEKALYIRLTDHFNSNKLLVGNQFSYRKDVATEDAIYKLKNRNLNALKIKKNRLVISSVIRRKL
jgi:hypothetical protein